MKPEKSIKERVLEEKISIDWNKEIPNRDYSTLGEIVGILFDRVVEKRIDITEQLTREECEKETKYKGFTAEEWGQQFAQAEMIIDDIKKVTGCKSNDGIDIVESVENLKVDEREKTAKEIFKKIDYWLNRTVGAARISEFEWKEYQRIRKIGGCDKK